MDKTTKRHILLLTGILFFAKLLMVLILVTVPVQIIGDLFNIPQEALTHNWRNLNMSNDNRPLVEKLGLTFDSMWYVEIARNGYQLSESNSKYLPEQCLYNWLFLYPLLIRIFSNFIEYVLAGLLVSNAASILAVVLFYFTAKHYVDSTSALKASVLLGLYPYNLTIWMASFSEPLFIIFALLAWIFFIKNKFVYSGFFIMLASLTRLPGLLLFPIFSIIYLMRVWGKEDKQTIARIILTLNVFTAPILYWTFIHVPEQTGYSLTALTSICQGYQIIPGGGILDASLIGIFFAYYALLAAYFMWKTNKQLSIYSLAFLLFHLSIYGAGGSLGRYIGVLWPLFIYYGNRLDSMDMCFFSMIFLGLASIMIELQANMVSWV